ncbi:MAG TPA: PP2C family protein-serine/threonine phosphatase, partial [Terriglobales bacterium]
LNSVLNPIRKPEMFVTMAFLAWDGIRLLAFSTAGHPPILHYCQETRVIKELLCSNLPLGMFAPQEFASDTVSLRRADVFVLFTDGLLEVTDKSGAEFGLEGIKAVLSSSEHETLRALADRILQAARAFGHTDDDESLLVVRC